MILLGILGLVLLLTVVALTGPRVEVDTRIRPVELPDDLESWLSTSESVYPDLVSGTEKEIIWAHPDKRMTPYSVVYLHGFSATRQETVPLSDNLARHLEANLFYTRLTGHGLRSEAMAEIRIKDLLSDAAQAVEIGKRIGEKVIVISVSTGSTLDAWLARDKRYGDVHCHIMLSPNFAIKDRRADLATRQWGAQLVRLMVGKTFRTKKFSEAHARYWTQDYPSSSLAVLATLVRLVRESPLEEITRPVLMIYSPLDQVVEARAIERAFQRFGSEKKEIYRIEQQNETGNHVLAGDILAPEGTTHIQGLILDFLSGLE